jgi:hypothetical protein
MYTKILIQQKQNIFFSSIHRTFSRIVHILGHKIGLDKLKKMEVTSNIILDHNGMKVEISNRRKLGKFINKSKQHSPKQPMNHRRNQRGT